MNPRLDKPKQYAKNQIRWQRQIGNLPNASELKCFHCGEPAHDYDHFKGYALKHVFHVLPVCRPCHRRIGFFRGELPRPCNKGRAKLTIEQVRFVRASRLPQQELADMFGVRQASISRVINWVCWPEVV